jgi:outer membrane receptor protein involved in Fe transport
MIRGPGSALYGTDAYNGVLNISTKDPRYNPGGNLSFSYGEQDTARLDLRYAGSLGRNWYFTVQGNYLESQDFIRSRNESVEYAGVPMEVVPLPDDKLKNLNAKIRLDKHFTNGNVLNFEVWGMDQKGWVLSTGVGRVQTTRGYQPLAKLNFKSSHWNILAYGYQTNWEGISLSTGKPLSVDTYRLQAELQGFTDFAKGKGRLVGGFSLRREGVDTSQTLFLDPKDEHMEALFGQADYKLTEKLKLVFAGRLDFSSLHDLQISPKVGVVYTFNPGHTLRLTFNRAFQSPNYHEFFLYMQAKPPVDLSAIEKGLSSAFGMDLNLGFKSIPVLALGNENLKVEEITSYEIGYSNLLGRKLLVNVNYYRNQLKNFISDLLPLVNPSYGPYAPPSRLPSAVQTAILGALKQNLPPSLFALMSNNLDDGSPIFAAVSFINAGKVNAQGVELNLKYFFNERWNVDLNYTWFDFEVKEELIGDKITSNSPEHRINLGMAYISDRFDISMRYRWVDDFFWGTGVFWGPVKSYSLVDLTSNFHLGNGFAIGINISNMLDNKHYESFGGYILRRHAVASISYRW